MQEVLAPKVHGTVWLDKATQQEPLDFFVLFSSVAAISGNIGQSDYAYSNSFMDYYATWRSEQENRGKTLSINWPLWKEGGMTIGEEKASFLKVLGMEPMSTENGINTFVAGLKQSAPQLIVAQGDVKKIKDIWGITKQPVKEETVPVSISVEKDNNTMVFQRVQEKVIQGVSAVLKIDKNEIDLHSEMNEFGFDSVTLTEYSNLLNEQYNLNIMPSIFFEHSTLYAFTEYLWDEYNQVLKDYYLDEIVAFDKKTTMQVRDVPMVQKEEILSLEPPLSDNKPARNERSEQISDPIAIVGISGVMPQSPDLASFWKNLEEGKDLITEIPDDRWDWKAYYGDSTKESNNSSVKWGGFIPNVDKFDALFFGISPREAAMMDPQQRILMETVWKTIEDAGYKTSDLSGTSTGIFIGTGRLDYIDILKEQGFKVDLEIGTGNSHIMMVNRISYLLNLRGPSEPVDTACSSSLVAIHRAVESIRNGDCDMAIAGGINLILSPSAQNTINNWGLLCEDGRCKTFDKRANGYVRGEGCGVLLLKPLSKAEADGDHIYGVIKGTAINHGGRANSLSAPNPTAQAELLVSAWKKAQVDPTTVTYIESHGTGTSLGDPIEINGMKKAFEQLYKDWGKTMPSQAHCGIGAVKSNIGHLESASGIAGILKVLLAMKHQRLPRNLHLEEMNPYIQLEGSPFYLLSNSKEWERLKDEQSREIPRRAGVSAFGFGGVNAHIVLEEYERPVETATQQHREQIIVLSAKNKDCLKTYAGNMVNYLETTTSSLEEIAYTLQVGREAMEERLALIVSSIEELRKGLNYYIQGNTDGGKLFISNSKASDKNIIKPLLKGRAGKEFIRIIVEDQQIAELGRLWVAGVDIEWELLYQFYKPNRLPLSTYPFEKTSYWYKDFKDIVLLSSNEVDNDEFIELETRGSGIELNNIDLEKNKEIKILEENNYSALSSIENKLTKIWSTMLDSKEVDINQTFFDLGGDSISIIKLFEEVDRQFPGKINITDFFSHPTVAKLAQHICSENNVMNTSIKQIEEGIKGYQLKNN
ncbi:Polyketide synthase PksN [Bacillus megaterium]|nr:Polyketide synthase PksN [Priestia megaterium]